MIASEIMSRVPAVIDQLGRGPAVVKELIYAVPPELRKRRPATGVWSAHEHAVHLPAIYPQAASVHLWGDTALVICEESFREGRLVATNIFVREADDWRLLHHQAGPLNPSADIDDVDSLFDDGDPDALLGLHDDDPAADAGEHAALSADSLDDVDNPSSAQSSADELLALYAPRRRTQRFVN